MPRLPRISNGSDACEITVGLGHRIHDYIAHNPDARAERRGATRVELHCVLTIFRAGELPPVTTYTLNISNSGFYCVVPVVFDIGEHLLCEIHLPVDRYVLSAFNLRLNCELVVVRIEKFDHAFGIGWEIEDFTLAVD